MPDEYPRNAVLKQKLTVGELAEILAKQPAEAAFGVTIQCDDHGQPAEVCLVVTEDGKEPRNVWVWIGFDRKERL